MRACKACMLARLGCATNRFSEIATQAAAWDAKCDSSRAVEVEELTSNGYRAHVRGGETYHRRWYRRVRVAGHWQGSMGRVQCCQRVESADEATEGVLLAVGRGAGSGLSRGGVTRSEEH